MKLWVQQVRELTSRKNYLDLVSLLEYLQNRRDNDDAERAYSQGILHLEENVPVLRKALGDKKRGAEERRSLLRGFGLISSHIEISDIRQMIQILVTDDDPLVRKTAFEVLTADQDEEGNLVPPVIGSLYLSGVPKMLSSMAGSRLSEYLPELIGKAANVRLTEECLRTILSPRNWLLDEHCKLVIRDKASFFLGYEFDNDELRDEIQEYFEKHDPSYHMETAGRGLTATTVPGEIIRKILKSAFAVFDLSPSRKPELNPDKTSNLPNYNVVLELGWATAWGVPSIEKKKKGTLPISDLGGWQRIEYKEVEDLPGQLQEKLSGKAWTAFLRGFG